MVEGPAHPPLWLILPIIAIAALRITSWILYVCMPRMKGAWTRDMRSLWGAYQATAVYALWAAIVLAAVPVLVYALREYRVWIGLSGILSLVVARTLTLRNAPDEKKRPISAALVRWLLGVAIGTGLLLTAMLGWRRKAQEVKAEKDRSTGQEAPVAVDEFAAADELDNDFEADKMGACAMQVALERLRGAHLAFRRADQGELRNLEELRLKILTAVTESPSLEDYYHEA